jgi:hypothetical protein
MTPKPTSAVDARHAVACTPVRVVIVTMDTHLASSVERARKALVRDYPGLHISLHAASEYAGNDALVAKCKADIAQAEAGPRACCSQAANNVRAADFWRQAMNQADMIVREGRPNAIGFGDRTETLADLDGRAAV